MNQREYRQKKETQRRLAEAKALSPHAGPQMLDGGKTKGVVEAWKSEGVIELPADERTPVAANPVVFGLDNKPVRATKSKPQYQNPVNQFYGIPEAPTTEGNEEDD